MDKFLAFSTLAHEVFRGQTVWKGFVEVFKLFGHPKAKKAYAWSRPDEPDNKGERFVTVLEIPPVESPVTAVRASIMADANPTFSTGSDFQLFSAYFGTFLRGGQG